MRGPRVLCLASCVGLLGCEEPAVILARVEGRAKEHCEKMHWKCEAVACVSRDSDNDGYVSCSVKLADVLEPVALECLKWESESGCKTAIPKVRVTP
jgi:hypothetical protein